ncbi:MAG: Ppx/GppA family phosphatase [Thermoplasmata archaeon]|nr:Ppx/GppA family phosphatase [Thermoplasmata archaeon]
MPKVRAGGALAVMDVGSNTARLVVFETTPEGGFRSTFETKEVPRLGKSVAADGSLSASARARGVAAIRRFARQLDAAGRPPTVAVATSAVRDAPNGKAFLSEVRRETGIEVRLLTGEEEGRFAYLGVGASFELADDLVVDLGGGSLQAASTRSGRPEGIVSLPLGALRLTQRFLRHDPPKPRELDALRGHVREHLRLLPPESGAVPRRLFGVGGTIRCLARVSIELDRYPLPQVHGYTLTRSELARILHRIGPMEPDRRRQVPGITGTRADVIVAGLVVVDELLRKVPDESMTVCGTGIREGIVVDRIGAEVPASAEKLAFRSVTAASRSFGFSLAHGREVERVALTLFDLLQPRYEWGKDVRRSLRVGAWMHDVGTVVEIWRHPRHSAYLLRYASILGLTHRETALAALAVAQHHGDPLTAASKKEWRSILSREDLSVAEELGAILFFAETLDGAQVHLALARGSDRLRITPIGGPGSEASERAIERLTRAMERAFDLEVVVYGRN